MKKTLLIILPVFLVLVACGLSYLWWRQQIVPANQSDIKAVNIVIVPGQSGAETISDLLKNHLIRSALAAKIYLKLYPQAQKIKPGTYELSSSQSLSDLFAAISIGPKDLKVTIPEGWRREQIAARLGAVLSRDTSFNPMDFIRLTATIEGQLFPDTYLIPPGATTAEVVSQMTGNFQKKAAGVDRETLILASLVEREAKTESERPIIAGILKKRLSAGWPLQVDASVQYARDTQSCQAKPLTCDWWAPVFDTKLPSIYNTYLITGLPPAPVCNPGLPAIQAAVNPADTPYWYYLTDENGVTHYAKTLTEHNLNVDKYLLH